MDKPQVCQLRADRYDDPDLSLEMCKKVAMAIEKHEVTSKDEIYKLRDRLVAETDAATQKARWHETPA